MLPGYNHNVEYQGRTFHIQTEDSGINNPHIISHLFEGGNILDTRKCDYTNILDSEQRDKVLMSLMLNQHQALIRELESGQLDELLTDGPSQPPIPAPTPGSPEPTARAQSLESEADTETQDTESGESGESPEDSQAETTRHDPEWLLDLPPPRILRRKGSRHEHAAKSEDELAAMARNTINEIVEGSASMRLPTTSNPQDSLDDAMNVILSSVDEESNPNKS